jgi:hypothetical protein
LYEGDYYCTYGERGGGVEWGGRDKRGIEEERKRGSEEGRGRGLEGWDGMGRCRDRRFFYYGRGIIVW